MILAGCFIILVIVLAWFPLIRSKRKFKPMWATPCKSFCKKLWDTINAGRTWKGDFINRKKNGEEFWESASISPIKNSEGEITHFVAVKQDITERKQLEEELIRARQAADRIRDAVEMGDVTRIKSIVEDLISKSDAVASLGDKFIQMAADFDFDGVLKLADQLAIEVKTT
jgi:hypothetical protein